MTKQPIFDRIGVKRGEIGGERFSVSEIPDFDNHPRLDGVSESE
jgi:hypothetical protein